MFPFKMKVRKTLLTTCLNGLKKVARPELGQTLDKPLTLHIDPGRRMAIESVTIPDGPLFPWMRRMIRHGRQMTLSFVMRVGTLSTILAF